MTLEETDEKPREARVSRHSRGPHSFSTAPRKPSQPMPFRREQPPQSRIPQLYEGGNGAQCMPWPLRSASADAAAPFCSLTLDLEAPGISLDAGEKASESAGFVRGLPCPCARRLRSLRSGLNRTRRFSAPGCFDLNGMYVLPAFRSVACSTRLTFAPITYLRAGKNHYRSAEHCRVSRKDVESCRYR